ncbi:metallophosphoesterase family protein [Actinomycetospora aeridis]|uniref:Metallophosphoesterase family protein n=1 Tax=Actinomycetospora aeridis TaxID=3129231 RepID=A0ABU8N7T6_9PSEU
MRLGLISDVHANLPALDAALAALDRAGVDTLMCAGDLVGYGPHPNACVARIAERGVPTVAGNHDLMALGELSTDRCVGTARESQRWTRGVLSAEARAYLAALPARLELPDAVVAHGSLDDPEEYVVTPAQVTAQLAALARRHPLHRVLVLGHTHRQRLDTSPEGRRLVNPGATGQSRQWERGPRARCAVVTDTGVEWLAVRYDARPVLADLQAIGISRRAVHAPPGPRRLYWAARARFRSIVRTAHRTDG